MIKRSKDLIINGITPKLLKGCIAQHQKTIARFNMLDNYYVGRHDILNRVQESKDSPNNRIVANFPKYITDTAVGYMFGNAITYQYDEPNALDDLKLAHDRADVDTHDAELGKNLSVFGLGYELIYMSDDESPTPMVALIDPREAFVVYDDTVVCKPLFGVYYYKQYNEEGEIKGYNIIVYTESQILNYNVKDIADTPDFKDEQIHYFGGIPLIEFWNNEEGMGDFEHVISIINAYNVLQSDRVNDKERFVDSILVIKNAELEEGEEKKVLKGRILLLPGDSAGASYLTKTLNETETEVLKKSLAEDIHKFSQTPDFTDEKFSGNTSGVAMKFKLLPLEYLAKVKERFFGEGLRARLKLFIKMLSNQGKAPINIDKISIVFNRTLPINELENAQTVAAYSASGTVSKETLLTQISFVKDKDAELEKLKQEQNAKIMETAKAFGSPLNADDIRL